MTLSFTKLLFPMNVQSIPFTLLPGPCCYIDVGFCRGIQLSLQPLTRRALSKCLVTWPLYLWKCPHRWIPSQCRQDCLSPCLCRAVYRAAWTRYRSCLFSNSAAVIFSGCFCRHRLAAVSGAFDRLLRIVGESQSLPLRLRQDPEQTSRKDLSSDVTFLTALGNLYLCRAMPARLSFGWKTGCGRMP